MLPDGYERNATDAPDLLPARMLNEYIYCPRLFHLEWAQGEWADNADTVSGRHVYRRVDVESGAVFSPEDLGCAGAVARSVSLSFAEERLIANIDLLEMEGRVVRPIDPGGNYPDTGGHR